MSCKIQVQKSPEKSPPILSPPPERAYVAAILIQRGGLLMRGQGWRVGSGGPRGRRNLRPVPGGPASGELFLRQKAPHPQLLPRYPGRSSGRHIRDTDHL